MADLVTVAEPGNRCPNPKPHGRHEWYGTPAVFRRECPGVAEPGDHTDNQEDTVAVKNPTGLDMLAEVAADRVHRDQAGRSWYRTWSNEVTRQVAELVDAGWLSTRFVDGQWLLTAAGQTALKEDTRVLPAEDRPRPRVAIEGNACCGGNGVEASCEVCRRD